MQRTMNTKRNKDKTQQELWMRMFTKSISRKQKIETKRNSKFNIIIKAKGDKLLLIRINRTIKRNYSYKFQFSKSMIMIQRLANMGPLKSPIAELRKMLFHNSKVHNKTSIVSLTNRIILMMPLLSRRSRRKMTLLLY